MYFRMLSSAMTALFAFAAMVQYNDPDPLAWIALYVAAATLSAVSALRGRPPRRAAAALGLVSLAWGVALMTRIPAVSVYTHMFDAWEMQSTPIEEAREASGLLIVTAWMAVLASRERAPTDERTQSLG